MTGAFVRWMGQDFHAYWQGEIHDFVEREVRETRERMLSTDREILARALETGALPAPPDLARSAFVVFAEGQGEATDLWGAIAPDLRDLPNSLPLDAVRALRELDEKGRGILRPAASETLVRHREALRDAVLAAVSEAMRAAKKPGALGPRPYKPSEIARWMGRARDEDVWLPPREAGFVLPLSARSPLVFLARPGNDLHRWIAVGSFLSCLLEALESRPGVGLSLACTTASQQSPDVVPRLEEETQRLSENPAAANSAPTILSAVTTLIEGTVCFTFVDVERLAERLAARDGPGVEVELRRAVEVRLRRVRATAERLNRDCVPEQKLLLFTPQENSAILHGEDEILSEYLVEGANVPLRSLVDTRKEHFGEIAPNAAARVKGALDALRAGQVDEAALARVGERLGVEAAARKRRLVGSAAPTGRYAPAVDVQRLLEQLEQGNGRLAYLWWNDREVPDSFLVPP